MDFIILYIQTANTILQDSTLKGVLIYYILYSRNPVCVYLTKHHISLRLQGVKSSTGISFTQANKYIAFEVPGNMT